MQAGIFCYLMLLGVLPCAAFDGPKIVEDVGGSASLPKTVKVDAPAELPSGSSQEGNQVVDVKLESAKDSRMKMMFTSHGKHHELDLVESRIQLENVPIRFLGQRHEEAIANVKKVKMMVDPKNGATIAVKTDVDGNMEPVFQGGSYEMGGHEFAISPHSTGKAKVSKRAVKEPVFGNDAVYRDMDRLKRATSSPLLEPVTANVELVMLVDFSLYEKFHNDEVRAEGAMNQTEDLLLYFAHVASIMDITYKAMQNEDITITVSLAGIVVLAAADAVPDLVENHTVTFENRTYIDGDETLDRLANYRYSNSEELPPNDHVMLFSNYDLTTNENPGLLGIAYFAAVCSDYSVSFVEVDLLQSFVAVVASHELGHSLGADHDGVPGYSEACKDKNFVMASYAGNPEKLHNKLRFSCCTQRNFYYFLSSNYSGNCLQQDDAIPNHPPAVDENVVNYLPGEVYDADDQCYMGYGTAACDDSFYISHGINKCLDLYCVHPDNSSLCITTLSAALDGTECANDSICYQGKCASAADVQLPNDKNCNPADCYGSEQKCTSGDSWRLLTGSCYPKDTRCNGEEDCMDGSDETGCSKCKDLKRLKNKCRAIKQKCKKANTKQQKKNCRKSCRNNRERCCDTCCNQLGLCY